MCLPRMASELNAKKKELETLYGQLLSFQMDTIAGDAPSRTAPLDVYITKFFAKTYDSNSGCVFFEGNQEKADRDLRQLHQDRHSPEPFDNTGQDIQHQ